ncbi:MAG TPA: ABC transporter substrate-binding protein [Stellaceae bacterium]|nr:ABC transporter substrate-binding protein [Stellaceae bacterium]
MKRATGLLRDLVCGLAALLLASGMAHAEALKIATVKSTAVGALYIAVEKGYFAAVGIEPHFIYFDSPGAVPLAVVSGSADIGSTGVSAQLYALASRGALRIFAGQAREAKGFQVNAFILSNAAAAAGLTRLDELAGHSVAISLIGSPVHYAAAQVALKHGVALDRLRFLALQSNGNIVSAVTGGSADTGVIPATVMAPALARGDLKLLAWVGDEVQWQSSALIAAPRLLDDHSDLVKRFLIALRRGLHDYHDAFTAPDGTRRDGSAASAVLGIMAKYLGQTPDQLRLAIPYVDPDARLDFTDMKRQLAWFEAQNMLKGPVTLDQVIDRRFAVDVER